MVLWRARSDSENGLPQRAVVPDCAVVQVSAVTTAEPARPRIPRVSLGALVGAVVYSSALLVAGLVVPFYSTLAVDTGAGSGVSRGSATLVAVNGPGVVLVLGIPLVVSLAVGCALWQRTRRGAVPVAWALTGLFIVFNVLAMLSIGVFVLPVTLALVIACATCPREPAYGAAARPAAPG